MASYSKSVLTKILPDMSLASIVLLFEAQPQNLQLFNISRTMFSIGWQEQPHLKPTKAQEPITFPGHTRDRKITLRPYEYTNVQDLNNLL